MAEHVHDEGADHHRKVVHRHDERQRERRRAGRSDGRRLVVDDGLDHPVAEAREQRPDDEHRLVTEDPHAQQPRADQPQRHEVDVLLQRADDPVDKQPGKHDRQEEQRDQHTRKRTADLVVVDQKRGVEGDGQHGVSGEEVKEHQSDELAPVDPFVAHLDALLRLGRGAAAPEEERQRERDARQGIDQERKMPDDI